MHREPVVGAAGSHQFGLNRLRSWQNMRHPKCRCLASQKEVVAGSSQKPAEVRVRVLSKPSRDLSKEAVYGK